MLAAIVVVGWIGGTIITQKLTVAPIALFFAVILGTVLMTIHSYMILPATPSDPVHNESLQTDVAVGVVLGVICGTLIWAATFTMDRGLSTIVHRDTDEKT